MRKRFEQQIEIGQLLIQDTQISLKSKDSLDELMAALKEIFVTLEYNERIFSILENVISKGKQKTGRKGMDLWQIFVLSQVRLCIGASYERLLHLANYDHLIRQIMGVEKQPFFERTTFEYQNIYDNVTLLDDETVKQLNEVIIAFGHDIFKKKEGAALRLKTDSYVVESNVHFPTDYNLLWDCARKCMDGVSKFVDKYCEIKEWRKLGDWRLQLKGLMRELGRACASGGKNKDKRIKKAATEYLAKANTLAKKIESATKNFPIEDMVDLAESMAITHYLRLMEKHIDLVHRRLIKGETIPHEEKMFSIFEDYTELIKKGKTRPNVELGKKLAITTDQYNLIIDYQILDNEQDRQMVEKLAERLLERYDIKSWSFDKGYWTKENKELLRKDVEQVIMPKLGKRNKQDQQEETSRQFKKLKNKHSAIESNINELENRGLDRCPDRSIEHYKRYIALGVTAYNLKKIGKQLLEIERQKQQKKQPIRKQAA
jgi:IS5 family transposase